MLPSCSLQVLARGNLTAGPPRPFSVPATRSAGLWDLATGGRAYRATLIGQLPKRLALAR